MVKKRDPVNNSEKMTTLAGTTVNQGKKKHWERSFLFPQDTHSVHLTTVQE